MKNSIGANRHESNGLIMMIRKQKYLHLTTLHRRRKNYIERIKNNTGGWVTVQRDIQGIFQQHFEAHEAVKNGVITIDGYYCIKKALK